MNIDAMIDRFRDTGCAYAIDGKQGGRLLSPLQQVDYRDFAANPWINPQSFTQACAANIGDNDNWNAEITFRYSGVSTVNIYGYSYNGNFYIRTMDLGAANGGVGVWITPRFITSPVYDIVDASGSFIVQSNGLAIKSSVFPAGEFHTINIKRTDSGAEIYFDGVLKSNVTGTINTNNSAWSTYTDQGNVQSMLMKNSAGVTIWQASSTELYSGWLLNILATQPSQNTFERRNGLLSYADSVVTSANGVFSAVNPATASLLTLPLQLGGYTGSLTMLWKGNVQEDAFGSLFFTNPTTGISLNRLGIQINDGTTTVNAQDAVNPVYGEQIRVGVVDRENKLLTLYVNGNVIKSLAIPDTFGALNSAGTVTYAGCSGGLEALAFWPRALSAEEVAAL